MTAADEQQKSVVSLTLKKIQAITTHIALVQQNAAKLGQALIETGSTDLGLRLIANAQVHDNSKFFGIEFEYLALRMPKEDKQQVALAVRQHRASNPHHPEFYSDDPAEGIKAMPPVYLAECVCDWAARSTEFGTDLRSWIKDEAYKRYSIAPQGNVAKEIKKYVDLLLDPPMARIN